MEKKLTSPIYDPKSNRIYDCNRANLCELQNLLYNKKLPKEGREIIFELLLEAEYEAPNN